MRGVPDCRLWYKILNICVCHRPNAIKLTDMCENVVYCLHAKNGPNVQCKMKMKLVHNARSVLP